MLGRGQVAVFLTEDWTGGNFSQWEDPNYEASGHAGTPFTNHHIRLAGGLPAFMCSWGSNEYAYIGKVTGTQPAALNALTARFRLCVDVDQTVFTPGSGGTIDLFQADGYVSWGSSSSPNFNCQVWINALRQLVFRIYDNTSPTLFTSASGVVPFDGTEIAVQIYLTIPTHDGCAFKVVVDNVTVIDNSFSPTENLCIPGDVHTSWGYFTGPLGACSADYHETADITHVRLNATRYPQGCGTTPSWHTAITYIELDNAASVISFLPTGRTILRTDCWALATVTGLAYNCTTGKFTITGTNFIAGAQVIIRNPNNDIVFNPFVSAVDSLTSTQIVVTPTFTTDIPFFAGRYCATVTNACT
jgi:hypothetical protein